MDQIRVIVMKRDGRKFYEARWIDPATGLKKTKTTKTAKRREAERFAAKLEERLNSGESVTKIVTWKEFRKEYEQTVYPEQKIKTKKTTATTFNAIERICNPARASSIDAEAIRKFTKTVRKETGS